MILVAVLDPHVVHSTTDTSSNDRLRRYVERLRASRRHGHVKDAILGVSEQFSIRSVVLSNDAQATGLGHAIDHIILRSRDKVPVDLVEVLFEACDIQEGFVPE